jgi:hypothetical protein
VQVQTLLSADADDFAADWKDRRKVDPRRLFGNQRRQWLRGSCWGNHRADP